MYSLIFINCSQHQNLERCSSTSLDVGGGGKAEIVGAMYFGSFSYIIGCEDSDPSAFKTLAHNNGK